MTDTPALLPPDLDRDGWHWASYPGLRPVPLFWVSKAQLWITPGPGIAPDVAAKAGYTFASDPPRPIPSAAALERLHKLVREIHDRQPKHEMRILRSLYGGKVVLQRSMSASAYADAAAMLRAALEDKG